MYTRNRISSLLQLPTLVPRNEVHPGLILESHIPQLLHRVSRRHSRPTFRGLSSEHLFRPSLDDGLVCHRDRRVPLRICGRRYTRGKFSFCLCHGDIGKLRSVKIYFHAGRQGLTERC